MNRETWKNIKVIIAGFATGICLMSFITLNNTNEIDTTIETHTKTQTPPTNEIDKTTSKAEKTTEEHKTTQTHTTTTKWWVRGVRIVSAGVGVGFWAAYLAQELEERRRYKLLCQTERRGRKMLATHPGDEDAWKTRIEDCIKEEMRILGIDSTAGKKSSTEDNNGLQEIIMVFAFPTATPMSNGNPQRSVASLTAKNGNLTHDDYKGETHKTKQSTQNQQVSVIDKDYL